MKLEKVGYKPLFGTIDINAISVWKSGTTFKDRLNSL